MKVDTTMAYINMTRHPIIISNSMRHTIASKSITWVLKLGACLTDSNSRVFDDTRLEPKKDDLKYELSKIQLRYF